MKENLSIGSIVWFWFWLSLILIDDMSYLMAIQKDEIFSFDGKKKAMICAFSIYLGKPVHQLHFLAGQLHFQPDSELL